MKNSAPQCGSSDERNVEYSQLYSPERFFKYFVATDSPVIFDIGAHRGESVLFFKEIFPALSIFSFEPDPENYNELQKCCFKVNSESSLSVPGTAHAICKAVGEKPGPANFYKQSKSHLGSLSPINKASMDSLGYAKNALNEVITVESTTIDEFAAEMSINYIDILKIDAQGLEVSVLRGAREMLKHTTCLTVEVSLYDFYEKKSSLLLVEQEMLASKMTLWDISKVSKNPINFRTDWVELVYLKETVAKVEL